MSNIPLAPWYFCLAEPTPSDVLDAIARLRRAPDVQRVAVMPDVHLATDVCIGIALATSHLIYPQAVGGDIGCGMLAVAIDADATALEDPGVAMRVLAEIARAVPTRRRNRRALVELPDDLEPVTLSDGRLDAVRRGDGAVEFATLGSGNHFAEIQADEGGRLWLMVHSGSRAVGQAIHDHHLAAAEPVGGGLRALDAWTGAGAAYLHDVTWARRFADANRKAIAERIAAVLAAVLGAATDWSSAIATDHNHVALERHFERDVWVHRKGAMPARSGETGVLPGSMGSESFHVQGRGNRDALCSSAHGAGRLLTRTEARRRVSESDLRRQMRGVWYDVRLSGRLRDEAPSAYKDVRAVLRAQRNLVKTVRVLRPVVNYKGT